MTWLRTCMSESNWMAQILTLCSCVTLKKLLNFSEPQFPQRQRWINNSIFRVVNGIWVKVHFKGLAEYLADQFSSVTQSCQNSATPWMAACQVSPSITNSQSLLKLMSIESVMPSNHLILRCPLLLPPSILPRIRVFSNKSILCITWPKYWSFHISISPSSEYSGLTSFRIDWFDLLAVQGTLKSLLQHHSSKASILRRLAFFIVQLSYPYMTTGKTIALTRQTFVGKVMSLLFFFFFF